MPEMNQSRVAGADPDHQVPASDFTLRAAPPLARLVLRGGPDVARQAGTVLDLSMPLRPLQGVSRGSRSALWLGPDEWLVLAPEADLAGLMQGLTTALAAHPHSLVDVSHRQVGFMLGGRLAARVLSSGCPLDLGLKAFPQGMVTRTLFHKAEIVLWRQAEGFHLEVWRSFAPYVQGHLAVAWQAAADLSDAALP